MRLEISLLCGWVGVRLGPLFGMVFPGTRVVADSKTVKQC